MAGQWLHAARKEYITHLGLLLGSLQEHTLVPIVRVVSVALDVLYRNQTVNIKTFSV